MCELPPIETLSVSSAPGRACLVGESDRLCRARWVASGIDATSGVKVVPEILQTLCEVCRRDEGRKEEEEEENMSWDWMHVSGRGN